jgi:hypothetical protein
VAQQFTRQHSVQDLTSSEVLVALINSATPSEGYFPTAGRELFVLAVLALSSEVRECVALLA